MASVISRNNKFCVVYSYCDKDGKRRQKWETFKTLGEANTRKIEIEYSQQVGNFVIPNCTTVSELMKEYVSLYGKTKWSPSVYSSNTGLINHYIEPYLGKLKLAEVTSHTLERYYQKLLTTPAVPMICVKKYSNETRTITTATVRKIHNVLRSAFTQAMKWDLIEKNPAAYATVPKHEAKEREIWDAQTIFKAIELCKDPRLKLCLNLAFSCTLRIGELLALTWDCVDISDESIQAGKASISITKELQRVSKKAMKALDSKDIITVFPDQGLHNRTALVLKTPKTPTSIRKVFLPKTVAEMLVAWKMEQDAAIEAIGNEYADFNLVIATSVGLPCESAQIRKALKNLIEENNLPPVVFHSLRHSSITYKLKLNQGDIKSVQGDSGHAQASMVTDQYSHILDENRQENAKLLEKAFYNGRGAEPEAEVKRKQIAMVDQMNAMGFDPLQLAKVLSNPDMVKMLQMLAGSGAAT